MERIFLIKMPGTQKKELKAQFHERWREFVCHECQCFKCAGGIMTQHNVFLIFQWQTLEVFLISFCSNTLKQFLELELLSQ